MKQPDEKHIPTTGPKNRVTSFIYLASKNPRLAARKALELLFQLSKRVKGKFTYISEKYIVEWFRRLPLVQPRYFKSICSDFPGLFPIENNVMMGWLNNKRIIKARVVDILSRLKPIAEIGFPEKLSPSLFLRYLTIKEYYELCHNLISIDAFFSSQKDSEAGPILDLKKMHGNDTTYRSRNILFVTSLYPSPFHGGGNRVLSFMKILAKKNRIFLATSYDGSSDSKVDSEILPYCTSVLKIPYYEWGNNQERILDWLGGETMDIVHYEWPHSLLNFSTNLGRHHIFTYMESVSLSLLIDLKRKEYSGKDFAKKLSDYVKCLKIEFVDTAKMDGHIAVTDKDATFLRSFAPGTEYFVLNTGIDFPESDPVEIEPEPDTLLFLGNFGHYPNAEAMQFFLADIFPKVKTEVPAAKIYVVGPNVPQSLLSSGDQSSVIFTGQVPDFRPFVRKVQVCVAPLISGAGIRGKVVDYAAMKRPFVATDIAMAGMVFKDKRDYLNANNSSDFAESIICLLKDRALRSSLAANAYKVVRDNHDNGKLVELLYRLYTKLENTKDV